MSMYRKKTLQYNKVISLQLIKITGGGGEEMYIEDLFQEGTHHCT